MFADVHQEPPGPLQPLPWQGRAQLRRSGRPGGAQAAHAARRERLGEKVGTAESQSAGENQETLLE